MGKDKSIDTPEAVDQALDAAMNTAMSIEARWQAEEAADPHFISADDRVKGVIERQRMLEAQRAAAAQANAEVNALRRPSEESHAGALAAFRAAADEDNNPLINQVHAEVDRVRGWIQENRGRMAPEAFEAERQRLASEALHRIEALHDRDRADWEKLFQSQVDTVKRELDSPRYMEQARYDLERNRLRFEGMTDKQLSAEALKISNMEVEAPGPDSILVILAELKKRGLNDVHAHLADMSEREQWTDPIMRNPAIRKVKGVIDLYQKRRPGTYNSRGTIFDLRKLMGNW